MPNYSAKVTWYADTRKLLAGTGLVRKDMKSIADDAGQMGRKFLAAGTAMVGGMAAMVWQATEYGEAIWKAKEKTGESAEVISGLGYAAEQSGGSLDTVTTSLKFVNAAIDDAQKKAGPARDAFRNLGLSYEDTAGKAFKGSQVLLGLSDVMAKGELNANTMSDALAIVGARNTEILPLMRSGKDAILAEMEAGRKLGRVIDDETASSLENLGDTLGNLKRGLGGIATTFTVIAAPSIEKFATKILATMIAFQDLTPEQKKARVELLGWGTAAILGAGATGTLVSALAKLGPPGWLAILFAGGTAGLVAWIKSITDHDKAANKSIDALDQYGANIRNLNDAYDEGAMSYKLYMSLQGEAKRHYDAVIAGTEELTTAFADLDSPEARAKAMMDAWKKSLDDALGSEDAATSKITAIQKALAAAVSYEGPLAGLGGIRGELEKIDGLLQVVNGREMPSFNVPSFEGSFAPIQPLDPTAITTLETAINPLTRLQQELANTTSAAELLDASFYDWATENAPQAVDSFLSMFDEAGTAMLAKEQGWGKAMLRLSKNFLVETLGQYAKAQIAKLAMKQVAAMAEAGIEGFFNPFALLKLAGIGALYSGAVAAIQGLKSFGTSAVVQQGGIMTGAYERGDVVWSPDDMGMLKAALVTNRGATVSVNVYMNGVQPGSSAAHGEWRRLADEIARKLQRA